MPSKLLSHQRLTINANLSSLFFLLHRWSPHRSRFPHPQNLRLHPRRLRYLFLSIHHPPNRSLPRSRHRVASSHRYRFVRPFASHFRRVLLSSPCADSSSFHSHTSCRDKIAAALRVHLNAPDLTTAQVLESATWKGGREIAKALRGDKGSGPPLEIVSDGTVF